MASFYPDVKGFNMIPCFICLVKLEAHPVKVLVNCFKRWYLMGTAPKLLKTFMQLLDGHRCALQIPLLDKVVNVWFKNLGTKSS